MLDDHTIKQRDSLEGFANKSILKYKAKKCCFITLLYIYIITINIISG